MPTFCTRVDSKKCSGKGSVKTEDLAHQGRVYILHEPDISIITKCSLQQNQTYFLESLVTPLVKVMHTRSPPKYREA